MGPSAFSDMAVEFAVVDDGASVIPKLKYLGITILR